MNRPDAKDAKNEKILKDSEYAIFDADVELHAHRREPTSEEDKLAFRVIGAAIEVHRALGPGYLESVYAHALEVELMLQGVPDAREHPVGVQYKGTVVGESKLDFLVGGQVVVELKSVEELAGIHSAQIISYLKATGCRLGLLINFNVLLLKKGVKRVVLS